jgi:hypothetical protein
LLSKFSAFNFGFEAPLMWGLRIKGNSNSLSGAISVISHHQREGRVFVMWGNLSTVKNYDSKLHANEGVRLAKQSERWRNSDFTRLVRHQSKICTHDAHGYEFPSTRTAGFLNPLLQAYAVSFRVKTFYVHCETSGRYFIIVGELKKTENAGADGADEVYDNIVKTFECHEITK